MRARDGLGEGITSSPRNLLALDQLVSLTGSTAPPPLCLLTSPSPNLRPSTPRPFRRNRKPLGRSRCSSRPGRQPRKRSPWRSGERKKLLRNRGIRPQIGRGTFWRVGRTFSGKPRDLFVCWGRFNSLFDRRARLCSWGGLKIAGKLPFGEVMIPGTIIGSKLQASG